MSETLSPSSAMTFRRGKLSKKKLLHFYDRLVLPRLIEEKMLSLLRQGRISKWFAGIGQEAISVGCALALEQDEYMFTMHRNLGVFTTREVPFDRLFGQWQGKMSGYTKGRDRSFHFGATEHHIVGMISHLGPQLSLAAGVGLAHKLKKEKKVSLAFTGDGGTSQGEFHEALNLAAVWSLPTIFVIENNGYGLSTPVEEQYACDALADRAKGYGMEGISIDGNNILEVYQTIADLARDLRQNPRPVLVECRTFRMRGHEEASGVKYVPQELFDLWGKRDPVENFRNFLKAEGVLTEAADNKIRERHKQTILDGLAAADAAALPTADLAP
jgi:2-oxoisovalerate dehydrogenase E1 component